LFSQIMNCKWSNQCMINAQDTEKPKLGTQNPHKYSGQ
jgi:hypothetical protein